ncbi:MAG: selenide, water dikinase SelD [Terriglobales bacterium]
MRRLTELSAACGCAAKLGPQTLHAALANLPRSADANLLVGFEGAEDAAVYRLAPDLALVQTVDFFTPIVDDPADFGAIAAANALSDIYAMGGRPLLAVSVVGFPGDQDPALLAAILAGGAAKLAEAGCALGGGHSVRDPELKFGFSITGLVHPDQVLRNAGAQVGDRLYLTKAIGTGVITTALKQGAVEADHLEAALASMLRLNREAAEAALRLGAHGATDVTGFGLLGHACELARASGVHLRMRAAQVPLLPGARGYAAAFQSQGLRNNRDFVAPDVAWACEVDEDLRTLLFDPQTSGGLLLSLPPEVAFPAPCIGEVVPATARGWLTVL